jgi:hypothetical protein
MSRKKESSTAAKAKPKGKATAGPRPTEQRGARATPNDPNDPAGAQRSGGAADGDERPKFEDARMQETHDTRTVGEREAGVPPRPEPIPGRIVGLPTAGTIATSIPHADGAPGRFAYTPEAEEDEGTYDQKELDELATEFLKDPTNRAGTAHDQGVAAYNHARGVLKARKAGQEEMKKKGERKRGASKGETDRAKAVDEARAETYKGLDFANNPRAYAADPANAGDQGPKEPIAIDWRKIQDEEGRLRGNQPSMA